MTLQTPQGSCSVTTLEEAIAAIPAKRDALNIADDQISMMIQSITAGLMNLRVGISASITYSNADGAYVLTWRKKDREWGIVWGNEDNEDDSNDVFLLRAPRHVRLEVFERTGEHSPIEQLIINILNVYVAEDGRRGAALSSASRLVSVFEQAGLLKGAAIALE